MRLVFLGGGTGLRPAERFATIAVTVMTAPALVVFPCLGIWYLIRIWPRVNVVDRIAFLCALTLFFGSAFFCVRQIVRQIGKEQPTSLAPRHRALMIAAMLLGGWALTHRFDILLSMSAWGVWEIYSAGRRQSFSDR